MNIYKKIDSYFDKHYKGITASGIFIIGFFVVLYYILVCARTEIHADCFDTIMWGNASITSGKIFNRDFGYACLLPFGGQLLMMPFMLIFGLSYKAHTVGMVLFMLLFTFSLIFMLKCMGLSTLKTSGATFAVLMLTCVSKKMREIFWLHVIYYSLGLMFLFIGVGIALLILKNADKKNKVLFCVLGVWTFLCATDGIQALTIYILPLIAALVGYIVFDVDNELISKRNIIQVKTAVIVAVSAVLGIVLLKGVSGDITQGYADAYSKFNNSDTWYDNLSNLLECHYTLLGVDINADMPIMSFEGIVNLFRIILATIIAFAPFVGVLFYNKIKKDGVKLFMIAYFVIYALIMVGWVFGKISGANWRLVPIEISGIILTILLVYELTDSKKFMRIGMVMIVPFIICSTLSMAFVFKVPTNYEQENPVFEEIKLIEENGGTYGYGTFWNANTVNVLTDDKIKVRGVDITDGRVVFRSYQTQKDWYDGVTDKNEKYFLILSHSEFDNLDKEFYNIDKVEESNNYVLVLLKENIDFDI